MLPIDRWISYAENDAAAHLTSYEDLSRTYYYIHDIDFFLGGLFLFLINVWIWNLSFISIFNLRKCSEKTKPRKQKYKFDHCITAIPNRCGIRHENTLKTKTKPKTKTKTKTKTTTPTKTTTKTKAKTKTTKAKTNTKTRKDKTRKAHQRQQIKTGTWQ